MRIFMITIVCLALAAPAFAGMYKWTDKNGKIHFTDSLNKVPVDQRTKRHIRKMKTSADYSGGESNLPTASPASSSHMGANKEDSSGKSGGVDKQRVNDLLRLNQKKHYDHQ